MIQPSLFGHYFDEKSLSLTLRLFYAYIVSLKIIIYDVKKVILINPSFVKCFTFFFFGNTTSSTLPI